MLYSEGDGPGFIQLGKESQIMSRSGSAFCAIAACLMLLFITPAAWAGARFELGGGYFLPFDEDHREAFGAGGGLQVGISASPVDSRAEIFLDVGYLQSTGQDFPEDPTFELDDSKYRLIPVAFGVRADLLQARETQPLALLFGVSFHSIFTEWDSPFGEKESTPVAGVAVELRPEFALSDVWTVWVSQRLTLMGDASYRIRNGDIDFSMSALTAGVAFQFKGDR